MRQLFVILLVVVSFVANAQTPKPAKSDKSAKPFKVSIAAGYASPANVGDETLYAKAGFAYTIEPQYELSRNLEIGVRFEQAFILRPEVLDKNIYFASKAKSIMSADLTANYVIDMGTAVRPFIGIGGGVYYADQSQQVDRPLGNPSVTYPLPTTVLFGGMARAGVKFGILHVEADYNLVSNTSVTNAASQHTLTARNSYFSIKAGITIGGSR